MTEFDYIIEKINDSRFETNPFKFIYIEDFLSKDHFELITSANQINIPPVDSTEQLIEELSTRGYEPVPFPGCTTNIKEYVDWYNTGTGSSPGHTQGLIEGFGISFRLKRYDNPKIKELLDFLNSNLFLDCLRNKFNKSGETIVETAIQKYVSGYEISPHPDIRKKCLTYMVNINTMETDDDIHTHFMKFKKDKEYIYKIWRDKPELDRFWVPWDWCDTEFVQSKNNSITIFAPDNDTMHAVKLSYDHTKYQRTQIYGNLWYPKSKTVRQPSWREV